MSLSILAPMAKIEWLKNKKITCAGDWCGLDPKKATISWWNWYHSSPWIDHYEVKWYQLNEKYKDIAVFKLVKTNDENGATSSLKFDKEITVSNDFEYGTCGGHIFLVHHAKWHDPYQKEFCGSVGGGNGPKAELLEW